MITATVKRRYLSVAPRKVRFIADSIRGKKAEIALEQLEFLNKGAALDLALLVKSGIAAAKQKEPNATNLFVKEIFVDEGPSQKRRFLLARGQSSIFKKTSSHITLTISDEINPAKIKQVKKTVKKAAPVAKKEQE
jgi:large subunit ribosomal protein L22